MKPKKSKRARAAELEKRRRAGTHTDAHGRVHLALHRDPATGRALVNLEHELFKEGWQNQVAEARANTAYAVLAEGPSVARTVELALGAMASTSRLIDGLLARAPSGSVACRAGCDHCCHQAVGVTPPEALAIADYLERTLSIDQRARLTEHVALEYQRTRGLSAHERFSPDYPCVFLESGRCSIYEVRPLSCRGMNSLDASECEQRLRDPETRTAFLAQGSGGHSYLEPIRAFHAVSAGLQLALSELFRLDMRPLDLIAAMQLILNGDRTTARAWIAGRAAFAEARGGDSTNDLAIRDMSGASAPDEAGSA